jgi:hypothetical protein
MAVGGLGTGRHWSRAASGSSGSVEGMAGFMYQGDIWLRKPLMKWGILFEIRRYRAEFA